MTHYDHRKIFRHCCMDWPVRTMASPHLTHFSWKLQKKLSDRITCTLVIQPTGKGKSLCYQLVALQSKKQVFVFTPTIALMHDQAKQLQSIGISAVVLGDAGGTIDDLRCYPSQPLIVYLTPEYIFGPSSARRLVILKELAENGKISLIAIDEAHLLFEWEHFRYALSLMLLNSISHNCSTYSADQASRIFSASPSICRMFLLWLLRPQHHPIHCKSSKIPFKIRQC